MVWPTNQPSTHAPEVTTKKAGTAKSGLAVGIDFGTTFSGVAYASTRVHGSPVKVILDWPGSADRFRKVPTCIVYRLVPMPPPLRGTMPQVHCWGIEAQQFAPQPGYIKCEWFKLHLTQLGASQAPDLALPPGKQALDVIQDYLACLWAHAKEKILEDIAAVSDLNSATVVFTVPSSWSSSSCQIMKQAGLNAGIVVGSSGTDEDYTDRLTVITEPEAAAVHAADSVASPLFRPPRTFILCDAGGGTVDCSSYKVVGHNKPVELAETAVRTGGNCGSLFLDVKFESLIRERLRMYPNHLTSMSMQGFVHHFSTVDKPIFASEAPYDDAALRYTCFEGGDEYDDEAGLEFGELSVPYTSIQKQVFKPIIDSAVQVVAEQLKRMPGRKADGLVLVGGFSGSPYLQEAIRESFKDSIKEVIVPVDADISTAKGAARYALQVIAGQFSVTNVICPRSYLMQVKLPAEPQDILQRPAYITTNNAGASVCDKRLLYLARKGAMLRKGQRLTSTFCKHATDINDSTFEATMLTSEDYNECRYMDEADTSELCRWRVDLKTLPEFQNHFRNSKQPAFISFRLGLEVDSAEVRGLVMDESGHVHGTVRFEYF